MVVRRRATMPQAQLSLPFNSMPAMGPNDDSSSPATGAAVHGSLEQQVGMNNSQVLTTP